MRRTRQSHNLCREVYEQNASLHAEGRHKASAKQLRFLAETTNARGPFALFILSNPVRRGGRWQVPKVHRPLKKLEKGEQNAVAQHLFGIPETISRPNPLQPRHCTTRSPFSQWHPPACPALRTQGTRPRQISLLFRPGWGRKPVQQTTRLSFVQTH
jgi:hypothetical protein